MRWLVLLLLAAAAVFAANIRLYLKDGDYQIVREYEVQKDRVRFYSAERKAWEEIPLALIDLKRTEQEAAEKAAAQAEVVRQEQAEDQAINADKMLIRSVPDEVGVYRVEGQSLSPLVEVPAFKRDSTTQKILQMISPAPMIAGKTTVFVEGKASKYRITDPNPEFFFRLALPESLAIIKLDAKKDERIVEEVIVLPLDEGVEEVRKQQPTFKKQYEPRLYRVWPEKPLDPGEYAMVEYTEGAIAVRVWDFAIDKKK
jgi:hypothetical protein